MGKRGPKVGQMKARPRDERGHWLPVSEPIKAVPTMVFVASIEKNFGLATMVARELGLSLDHVVSEGKEIETLRHAFWAQNERVNDMAEMQLFSAIQRGEAWAICFRLKTKAKDRGYIERVENEGRFAFLGLNATVGAGKTGAQQRGDFDTEGYIELFRGFFGGPGDGIPSSDGAREPLAPGDPNS